jgi:dyslexia susceptibility 1 candidate gene 1 protein
MPVQPLFQWEQTADTIVVSATIKGFKKEQVDVLISDVWVKINAPPTYLLHLDLAHPIDVAASTFYVEMPLVRMTLKKRQLTDATLREYDAIDDAAVEEGEAKEAERKKEKSSLVVEVEDADAKAAAAVEARAKRAAQRVEERRVRRSEFADTDASKSLSRGGAANDTTDATARALEIWPTLCIDKKTPRATVIARRQHALQRLERLYNMKLDTRENIKEAERKRYFQAQWEMERATRAEIERKMGEERDTEARDLEAWRKTELARMEQQQRDAAVPPAYLSKVRTPGDLLAAATAAPVEVRQTVEVPITFTSRSRAGADLPSRGSRGDEDYYRRARYKPVSIEDSPMFWKSKGDTFYRQREWRHAADAYSESIKRDGVFLTCTANRAACWLQLSEYRRCIDDCDLAITMLSNTPASDTTQERYKYMLMKLHARRAAAKCWSGDFNGGLQDMRMAAAYRDPTSEEDEGVVRDLDAVEQYMRAKGLVEERDPIEDLRAEAHRLYYAGNYVGAVAVWREKVLGYKDPRTHELSNQHDMKARSNLAAALLQMGQFQEALTESHALIEQCSNVADALNEPGAQSTAAVDSDDEDEATAASSGVEIDDTVARRRNAAAKVLRDNSNVTYLLLKAFVRAGCAYCGLKDYKAALEMFERAVRVAPYDDDLRDDYNRVLEKARNSTLMEASARAAQN